MINNTVYPSFFVTSENASYRVTPLRDAVLRLIFEENILGTAGNYFIVLTVIHCPLLLIQFLQKYLIIYIFACIEVLYEYRLIS